MKLIRRVYVNILESLYFSGLAWQHVLRSEVEIRGQSLKVVLGKSLIKDAPVPESAEAIVRKEFLFLVDKGLCFSQVLLFLGLVESQHLSE